ncbi:type II secretion system F family protein [Candidatus Proelusimicrobium volucris]|uniref:type II secretion system F family protein n=1 Tax=Candidatus Proelusimicrobium volucris TaxID=3416225 RepID=UPI003D118FA1
MNLGAYTVIMLVVAVFGSVAVMVAVLRILSPSDERTDIADLEAKQIKSTSSFAKLRPQERFLDRIALFVLETFKLQKPLEEMYMLMGSPAKPQPVDILYYKIYCAIGLPILLMLVFKTPILIITLPLGFYLPDLKYKGEIQKRQQEMLGNFATTVDLTALIIESGLDYMTAFERIIKIAKQKTLLEVEIEKTLNETKLGYSRREALERLAARTGVQDIRSFVGLIVQSDELGTSLVDLLRNFSTDLRFRRLNKAEKLAAQASTKMLIPLFIFIFPVVFILIIAPMVADFMRGGMPF